MSIDILHWHAQISIYQFTNTNIGMYDISIFPPIESKFIWMCIHNLLCIAEQQQKIVIIQFLIAK